MKSISPVQGSGPAGWQGRFPLARSTFARTKRGCLGAMFLAAILLPESGVNAVPLEKDFIVRSWRVEHGLPHNEIRALLQSRDGYLWIGTRSGIARFDGSRFRIFRRGAFSVLKNDECLSMSEGSNGAICITTANGLTIFDSEPAWHDFDAISEELNVGERLRLAGYGSSDVGRVISVLGLEPGRILLSTHRALFLHDGQRWEFLSPLHGHQLFREREGNLWIPSRNGLFSAQPGPSGLLEFQNTPLPPGMKYGHTLAQDPKGQVWAMAGTEDPQLGWLLRYRDGHWERAWEQPLGNGSRPLFLLAAHDGGLWFPADAGRLIRWTESQITEYELPPNLQADYATTMFEDTERNLWVGTERSGLLCLQPRRVTIFGAAEGLGHPNTWALEEISPEVFCVGSDGGLGVWSGSAFRNYTEKDGLARDEIRALAADSEGRLWIGTGSGLSVFESNRLARVRHSGVWFEAKTRVVHAARDGSVWIGTATGLYEAVASSADWALKQAVGKLDVRAILDTDDQTFLLGTQGAGLHQWRRGDAQTQRLHAGEPSENIWVIHRDTEGVLWLASDRGLGCWRNDTRLIFTREHGLPANQVNTLVTDDIGNLWVGHDFGIYRVAREDLFRVADGQAHQINCVEYDLDDGLPTLEVNGQKSHPACLKLSDGRILFATIQGVVAFDPFNLPDAPTPPAVVIEEIEANGHVAFSYRPGVLSNAPAPPEISLSPGSGRLLKISYTGCAFVGAEATQFKYRLEGLDPDWIQADNSRQATYANLPPGRYAFQVVAANKHGLANEQGARFALVIHPFFHQTLGFRLLVAAGLLSGGTAGLFWRARRSNRLRVLQKDAAVSRERERLAKDLHDNLGPRLTQLTLLTHDEEACATEDKLKDRLSRAADCTHALLHALRDIIWASHPAADTLEGLTNRLSDFSSRFLAAASVRCRLDLPPELPNRRVRPEFTRNLLLVTQEALNNAVRHACAQEVLLKLRVRPSGIQLEIADDGNGFDVQPPGPRSNGLGLESIRERVEALGGWVDVQSAPGGGTRIKVIAPLKPET